MIKNRAAPRAALPEGRMNVSTLKYAYKTNKKLLSMNIPAAPKKYSCVKNCQNLIS